VFTDSAPVMEVALAAKAASAGAASTRCCSRATRARCSSWASLSWPRPREGRAHHEHCGTCERCIDICPTQAIVAPYQLDARRCISYLTIEHHGAIPRSCGRSWATASTAATTCQLVCPWNKYARVANDPDFAVQNNLDRASLVELSSWTEEEFLQRFEGSRDPRASATRSGCGKHRGRAGSTRPTYAPMSSRR
jgi:epoxyqueuosine reductase